MKKRINNIKTEIMKKVISLFVLGLMLTSMSYSQNMTIKADSVIANVGDSVTVAINFNNFDTIGSLTLFINFNQSYLSWGRGLNWHPNTMGGLALVNANNGTIIISWVDVNGALINGKLLDLKFQFNGGASDIAFSVNSEVTDKTGTILFPSYLNGLVIQALSIDVTASKTTICLGENTQLFTNVNFGYGSYTYQWSSVPAGFNSTLPNPLVTPGVNTTYIVTVSDGTNTASDSVAIEIFANPPPSPLLGLLPVDGSINLTRPFTFSWFPSLFATEYEIYLWKSIDPPSVSPLITTTQITYTYNANLEFGTNYSWKVVAKNVCFETESAVSTFTTRFLPDLIVNDVQAPISAYSGQNISVSWEIKNQGSGSTMSQQWYDRVYLSPDTTLETGIDELLGDVSNFSFLDTNQSYIQTASFTLPNGISGAYYIFIVTDNYNHLLEEFHNNNTGHNTSPILITLTPPPDLQVSSIITPNNTFSGLSINVTWSVKNFGSGPTISSYWQDRVYLTTDQALNVSNATNLGSFYHSGALQPDSSYSRTQSFTIPANVFGTYYIFVHTDFHNQVYEHATENNNIGRSDSITVFLTPPPDLQVTYISPVPNASNKESVSLTWTVQNLGGSATSTTFRDQILLADNPNDDLTNAIVLGTVYHSGVMNPGDSQTKTHNYTIPAVTGPYYFYIITDYTNNVFEHLNEDNNTSHSAAPVMINNPDLIVTEVLVPISDSTGQPITIGWTVKNEGSGDVINSSWQDRVMISYSEDYYPDSVLLLDTYNHYTNLSSGDSINLTINVPLPDFVTGPYYIFVYTDFNDNVFEGSGENNNITRSQAMIQIIRPDLIVSGVSSPLSGNSGQLINLEWVVKNNGAGKLFMNNWIDGVMYSTSQEYYPDSVIFITGISNSGELLPGDSIVMNRSVQLPNGVTGTYYMAVYTDFYNDIFENNNELNNVGISFIPIVVSEGPWPDLQISWINHGDSATASQNIAFDYRVSNLGTWIAQNPGGWIDNIYISSDPVWTAGNSTLLRTIGHNTALEIDSSYDVSTNVNIPNNLTSGYYYLFVYTDAGDSIFENTDNFNNVQQLAPIYINQYPPVDLTVIALNVPTVVNSGSSHSIDWTSKNIGQATTLSQFWYDQVFLSIDTIYDPGSDIYIDEFKKFGPLPPGTSYTTNLTITIPNGMSGDYYFIMVTDKTDLNNDADFSNNSMVARDSFGVPLVTTITLTPPPDLQVFAFSGATQGFSGQSIAVNWTIKNEGVGPTVVSNWTDKFYLSTDFTIETGDIHLGTYAHSGVLNPGDTYTANLNLNIPIHAYGNYILIVETDVNDAVYEHLNENNNTAYYFITIILPPPSDLIVSDISPPASAIAGQATTVSWTVKNIGLNPASGAMEDIIYFSQDTVWDINDAIFGTYNRAVTINPLDEATYMFTADLNNVSVGDYYVIVNTDILNNINESDNANNSSVSTDTVDVSVNELFLNTLTNNTLENNKEIYYKLEIHDTLVNETLHIKLEADSINGSNEFYIRYGDIPSRVTYDYSHDNPFEGNQEVLVPSLQIGTYYILVYGSTTAGTQQAISLFAKILDFEILSMDADKGGNSGSVTVKMRGSKFDTTMTVSLQNGTDTIIASNIYYIDPTTVYPTFDLSGSAIGVYDVVAEKTSGEITTLVDGFEIEAGVPTDLQVNVIQPANSRTNSVVSISIEYSNAGNIDIVSNTIEFTSLVGAPVSLTVAGLADMLTQLQLQLTETNGPPGIIRPGYSGSITIYSKSTAGLGFILTIPN